jgi:hypothetical protein
MAPDNIDVDDGNQKFERKKIIIKYSNAAQSRMKE